jgi:SAM-dependent methyltransferase
MEAEQMTTNISERDLQTTVQAWDQAAWSLAALALAARDDCPPELTAAAWDLLAVTGLTVGGGAVTPRIDETDPRQFASEAAAGLQQAAALAAGSGYQWGGQSDEALLAQGRAGVRAGVRMARLMMPMMGDLAGRMAAPGARMLDVGTGTGALAVGFAEAFPRLQVLGIDILDRALDLARRTVAASDAAARVVLRKQSIAEFSDNAGFDVAWVPAPFIPQSALQTGLPRVAAALRPGGWLILGHGKLGGASAEDALTRIKTIAFGGTALDETAACTLLRDAGLTSVRPMPTPAGAPAIAIAQKPE